MTKFIIFLLFFTLLFFINCKNKKNKIDKIELKQISETAHHTSTQYSNTRLNSKTFFDITIQINNISKKYKKMKSDDPDEIQSNLNKMEEEMQNVYKKFDTSVEEFNKFGETHYKELESFLKAHPEIDNELRSVN